MKKISILLSIIIALVSCNGNSQNQLKRYEVKSGIIQYKLTIKGKVMGSTISGSGTESLYFKNWGALELAEEQSEQITKVKFFGKENIETTKTHTMAKLDNGKSYQVDFDTKQILVRNNMMMDLNKEFAKGNVNKTGKEMLEAMGGKKAGTEDFLGYNCEVWDIHGAKQLMYKGAVLKLEMTTLGITTIKEATSAKFNVTVADSYFKLPDFPIQKEEGFMNNQEFDGEMDDMDASMDKIEKLSFEEWKEMATKNDPEMKEMSDEELRQTYNMIQKMIKMRKGK
jgi:hypothetical protein